MGHGQEIPKSASRQLSVSFCCACESQSQDTGSFVGQDALEMSAKVPFQPTATSEQNVSQNTLNATLKTQSSHPTPQQQHSAQMKGGKGEMQMKGDKGEKGKTATGERGGEKGKKGAQSAMAMTKADATRDLMEVVQTMQRQERERQLEQKQRAAEEKRLNGLNRRSQHRDQAENPMGKAGAPYVDDEVVNNNTLAATAAATASGAGGKSSGPGTASSTRNRNKKDSKNKSLIRGSDQNNGNSEESDRKLPADNLTTGNKDRKQFAEEAASFARTRYNEANLKQVQHNDMTSQRIKNGKSSESSFEKNEFLQFMKGAQAKGGL